MSAASVLFLWRLYLYQSSFSISFGGKMSLMNVWRATRRACDRGPTPRSLGCRCSCAETPACAVLQSFSSGMRELPLLTA
jgi:hypothetical protein